MFRLRVLTSDMLLQDRLDYESKKHGNLEKRTHATFRRAISLHEEIAAAEGPPWIVARLYCF
jgi:hypothetical protein